MSVLTVSDHDRDAVGMTYVYPVVSRRAGGVSVGVNLNPNNACNWRCVYCQVPGLVRGRGPDVDLARLEAELGQLLDALVNGDFMQRRVPEGARRLHDVALSGNGEPTTSPQFAESVDVVGRVLQEFGLLGSIPLIAITNGSQLYRRRVLDGIERMAALGGEVWFKLDSATSAGMRRIHSVRIDAARHLARLRRSAALCPTWVQTCLFAWRGAAPSEAEQEAYLACMRSLVDDDRPPRGVLLYPLARPSHQPEADAITPLPRAWLEAFARRIESTGMPVRLAPDL